MTHTDLLIGKVTSYALTGIAVIVFIFASSKLVLYDAEENNLMELKEGEFIVQDGNDGYRIYTKHANCEEVEVELYYESFMNRGDLLWDASCSADYLEFRPSTSGEWNYLGTVHFQGMFDNEPSNEVKVDFNISASHDVMIADRAPIESGLDLRTISLALFALAGLIFGVTTKAGMERAAEQRLEEEENLLQERLESPENSAALQAIDSMKSHLQKYNTSPSALFSSFDLNKDGDINHFELMEGLKSLGVEGLTPMDIGALVELLDINGDGQIQLSELERVLV